MNCLVNMRVAVRGNLADILVLLSVRVYYVKYNIVCLKGLFHSPPLFLVPGKHLTL